MSKQIEEIFRKYQDTFLYRQDEMKDFLIKYFEKAFKEQLIEDVQRIDATERIKTAGFQKELSAWRNTYRNIILSTCVEFKNEQKRYDYKFLFVEEKLDDQTIELIENSIDEASRLRRQFKFDESIEKIDEMIELIRNEEDEVFNKKLLDARKEILLEKAKEIGEIIKIEENVLPLVEEFSLDYILGDISDDINESLDQIGILLNEHRVEVRKEITNKSVLTNISGEVVELEKNIEIQEPEEEESKLIYNVQSGVSNPFDEVIEEAVISDLIPYNFEIMKVDLNGEIVKELPDNTLKEEGIELRWKLQNIQPKEKIEINYDLRRRISRTIIFLLKDQLKIIKTHSNINNLEVEGLYEARLPFSNSYGLVLDGVIVEDIIPLYYLHFIKEPTNILPAKITSSKHGELIKWNVGSMEAETLNYHYKLLELYKFEELKIAVNNLDNEGFGALTENNLIEALSKYREVISLLTDYIK